MSRRACDVLLVAALIAGFATQARPGAELDYPTRPITLVVPFAAGGSATTAARGVADKIATVFDNTEPAVIPDFETERIFQLPPTLQAAGGRDLPD